MLLLEDEIDLIGVGLSRLSRWLRFAAGKQTAHAERKTLVGPVESSMSTPSKRTLGRLQSLEVVEG
jgi:hypothetical protein